MSEEDGLTYFIKYAIVHDGIDADDLKGFIDSKEKWHKEMGGQNNQPIS